MQSGTAVAHGHFVRFYEHDDFLLQEVTGYISHGLDDGDTGIVIATPEHLQGLARTLNGHIESAGERFVALDAAETLATFMIDGRPDAERFERAVGSLIRGAASRGNGRVRTFGEMVALLVAQGNTEGAIELEQLWNGLGRTCRFSLFCAYPLAAFARADDQAAFHHICHEHGGGVHPTETFDEGGDADTLRRRIAMLQQQASSLQFEIARRQATEAKLLEREQELRGKVEQLAREAHRKDEFLAMLGHELRNPLAPIVTSLELMRLQGDDPRRGTRAREIIVRQVGLLIRMVDDLLDVSRITRGKIELRNDAVVIRTLVECAVESSRPLIEEHNHRLAIEIPEEPLSVLGDAARLGQVIANLLNNAAKYTADGGSITLSVRKESSNVVISVRDNGVGLPSEMRDKVFDLFYQGGNPLTSARGGLGLGLTVVRSVIQLHGGSVQALSDGTGHGSEFVVRLPLRGQPSKTANAPAIAHASVGSSPLRIMVVDDNVDAAQSLGDLLHTAGHVVRVVNEGSTALLEAERLRPDVVILDIGMPTMDGYELARRLRGDLGMASALLIAVTGFTQERDRVRAMEAGINHHMVKPVDLVRLETLLSEAARQPDGLVASPA